MPQTAMILIIHRVVYGPMGIIQIYHMPMCGIKRLCLAQENLPLKRL